MSFDSFETSKTECVLTWQSLGYSIFIVIRIRAHVTLQEVFDSGRHREQSERYKNKIEVITKIFLQALKLSR